MMNRKKTLFAICSVISILCLFHQPAYASANYSTVNIVDMHEKESQYCETVTDDIVDSYYGKTHNSNIYKMDASNWAYVVYDLDGQYSSFSGTLVASTGTGREASMNVAIFVDGNLKWGFSGFTKQNKPEDIIIDLNGAKTLSIKTSNSGEYSCGWIFFIDSKLTKAEQPVACNEYASLSIPHVIDSDKYEYSKNLMQDSYGLFHDGSHFLDASQNAIVLYNLNREYSTLSYSVVTSTQTGRGASMSIKVSFDGVEQPSLFRSGITKHTGKIDFLSIDVSNVETIKIETTNEGEYSCGWLYIVDDILSTHTHTNGDWIVNTEATCIKSGQKVQYCTECGEICASELIPANGHKAVDEWIETVPSTCTTPGKEVQYCSICGEICASEQIPANGHKAIDEWIEIVPSTCATSGKEVQYCSICGDIVKTQSIDCLPHIERIGWEILIEASCTDVGERVKRCINCNKIIKTEDIEKIPHNFSEWLVTSESWKSDTLEESRSCTQCGLLETREIESTPTQWLMYIAIVVNISIVIVTSFLYPLKFRKILTLDIICHHVLLVVLMFYYHINISPFFFIVLASIIICFLPTELLSILSSVTSVLGWGVASFFGLRNLPFFVALNIMYIAIVVYLKTIQPDADRT